MFQTKLDSSSQLMSPNNVLLSLSFLFPLFPLYSLVERRCLSGVAGNPQMTKTLLKKELLFLSGSSRSFRMSFHWPILGHMAILQPITVEWRTECLDWPGWVMCSPWNRGLELVPPKPQNFEWEGGWGIFFGQQICLTLTYSFRTALALKVPSPNSP